MTTTSQNRHHGLDDFPAALLRSAVDASPNGMVMVDSQGRIVMTNRRAEEIFGYDRDTLVGQPLDVLLPAAHRMVHAQRHAAFLADPRPRQMGHGRELSGLHKQGHEIPLEIGLAPFHHDGQTYVVASVVDVTQRRKIEQQNRWLSLAVDQGPTSVVMTDLEGRIEYVNPKFTEVTGYTLDEVRGKSPRMLKSGATPVGLYQDLWKTITAGRPWHGELLNRKKDGSTYWDAMWVYPLRDASGDLTRFLALKEDITDRKNAEQALRERDARFQQIADNIKEVFFVQDATYRETIYINRAYEAIWGKSCQSLYANPESFVDPIPPEDRGALFASIERNRRGEYAGDVEFRIVRPDGDVRWILAHAAPVRNEQGEVYRIAGVCTDITDRKRAENHARSLFENSPLPMWVFDRETLRILAVNSTAVTEYGYSEAEFLGLTIEQLRPRSEVSRLHAFLAEQGADAYHRAGVWQHQRKDGSLLMVELSAHDITFADRPARLVAVNNVTARVRTERVQAAVYQIANAAHTAADLQDLLRSVHEIVATLMPAKSFYIALYDEAKDQITFPYFVDEHDPPPPPRKPGRGITDHVLRTGEALLVKPEMKLEWEDSVGTPSHYWLGVPLKTGERTIGVLAVQTYTPGVHYEEGDKEMLQFVSTQIATAIERKRAEDAMAERSHVGELGSDIGAALTSGRPLRETLQGCCEALVRHLDAAFARIWTLNAEDQVLELQASAGMYTHLDGAHSRIKVGQYKIGLIASERAPHITNTVVGDPRVNDQEWAKREGMVAFAGYPLMVQGQIVGVVAMFARHPFTSFVQTALATVADSIAVAIERRRAEEALQESEQRARTLFETVNLIVLGLNADGTVNYVNPFYLKTAGYVADEVLGKSWFDFLPPEQRPRMDGVFHELTNRNVHTHYENPILTKSGEQRMVAWNNTVVRDPQGRVTGTLSIGEDITERNQLEVQLRQAQKMEAIGRLAGGVAHDFNNVLTAVFGYVDLLREELPEAAHGDLAEVRKAAERAAGLTRQLLAFSRQQVLEPAVLEPNELIEEFEKMLHRVIGEDVEMRLALGTNVGNVRADPGQLHQVIMNLVVNARDAMPTGGKLIIETANADLSEQYAELHQPVVPGHYVMLAVSDTGTGMSPEVKARIFEPFFTTKERGKGTGLGLSTVYGIVKQSGGYIWAYSELGRGTTFKIYLPRVDAPVDDIKRPREAPSLAGTETILLAEDDPMLRPLARGLLEKLGYTVLEGENAATALAVAQAHKGKIHLLVADVVMPGGSGRDLARELAKIRPETKALYVSGYTDDAIVHHGMLEPGLNFLQKPFTPAVLARKVREVLDAK